MGAGEDSIKGSIEVLFDHIAACDFDDIDLQFCVLYISRLIEETEDTTSSSKNGMVHDSMSQTGTVYSKLEQLILEDLPFNLSFILIVRTVSRIWSSELALSLLKKWCPADPIIGPYIKLDLAELIAELGDREWSVSIVESACADTFLSKEEFEEFQERLFLLTQNAGIVLSEKGYQTEIIDISGRHTL